MPAPRNSRSLMESSATAALTPETGGPTAFRLPLAAESLGDAASTASLARIEDAIKEIRLSQAIPLFNKAVLALRREDNKAAAEWALKALRKDERSGLAWHVLAIAREKVGDFANALKCYRSALELLPDEADIANDLGRLAYRMDMKDIAAQLFARYLQRRPNSTEALNNLACVLRDDNRYEEAIEILRPAIQANPEDALLWNTLGTILSEQGDPRTAITFYDESLRLDPHFAKARYNRGNACLPLGDYEQALVDCETAMLERAEPSDQSMMRLARSTIYLCLGRIGDGWDAYEERLNPNFNDVTHFLVERPRWTPEADLAGKRLLLIGEQGLGDEVLFANTLPDVIDALGPDGHLTLAVEKRLIGLFQRSFPTATVGGHSTYKIEGGHTVRVAPFVEPADAIDLWAPLASPLRRFRRSVEAYPDTVGFLKPDPERVEHWRGVLAGLGPTPKVGLLWKSLKLTGARRRYFSPFEHWSPVLQTPGVTLVNLQYGDCAEEIAEAKARFGVDIWTPPGINLKDDLDEVAALSCAVDVVLGFANATTNIAAACGAETWLISPPGIWPKLGTDRYPWYPQARVFNAEAQAWTPVMEAIASALAERFTA